MNKSSLLFLGVLLVAPLAAQAEDPGYQVQQSVPFVTNTSKIGPAAEKKLRDDVESLSVLLRYRPESSIEIAGYSDPSEKKPGPLAGARAQKVWEFLISQGLPAERMEPVGYGAVKGGPRVDIRVSAEDMQAMAQASQLMSTPTPAPAPAPEAPAAAEAAPAAETPAPESSAPAAPPAVVATPSTPTATPSAPAEPPSTPTAAEQAAQNKREIEAAKRQAAEEAAAAKRQAAEEAAAAKRQAAEEAAAARRAKAEQAAAEAAARKQAAAEAAAAKKQAAAEAAAAKKQAAEEAAAAKRAEAEELKRQKAEQAEEARQARLKAAEERKAAQQAALERKQAEAEARRQEALEKKRAAEEARKREEEAKIQQAMSTPPPTLSPEASDAELKTQKGVKIVDNQQAGSYVAPPSVKTPPKSALPGEGSYFIQGTAYFAANARTLTPGSTVTIDALATRLQKLIAARPDVRVDIVGHADPLTESAQADVLAEGRAEELMNELIARGVDREHLHPAGAADTQPLTSKKDDPARNLNMRAEVRVPTR